MKRLIVLAAVVATFAAACAQRGVHTVGPGGTGPTTASPGEQPSAEPSVTVSTASPVPSLTYEVWFTRADHLFVTKRTQPDTPGVGRASLEALLDGPATREIDAGVGTQVPPGTTLLDLSISNQIATVNLSGEFFSGGSAVSQFTRLGQVVYTISQFQSVKGVTIELDGDPVKPFSIQGAPLSRPWQRSDFTDLLPAILVADPVIGATVSSPVEISGMADVFEATVSLRILDENGAEIATGFTTATCGTGCLGDYSTTLAYHVDDDQPGTVEVFEASAENGQPINVVDIPVTLQA